jgi:RNA polymerase sigma factor (sigma-70 family)
VDGEFLRVRSPNGLTVKAIPAAGSPVDPDVWEASDNALLAGVAAGDEEAMTVLVRRFQRRVFGLARSILRDEGHATEVAQDAFVRAWTHAPSFDPRRGSAATWLLAITRNLAIDRVRMTAARPADPVDPETLLRVPSDVAPDEVAVARSETQRVLRALRCLPAGQRRCVVLATIGGRNSREISEQEHIPLGTAKTRLRDGLRRLRTVLDDDWERSRD